MAFSRARTVFWLIALLIYLCFYLWYVDLRGRLTQAEIQAFTSKLHNLGYDQGTISNLQAFMESDTGRQFLMVNIMELYDGDVIQRVPVEAAEDDEPEEATTTTTAEQLLERYTDFLMPLLFQKGCHPTTMGVTVAGLHQPLDEAGLSDEMKMGWSSATLMRYKSRRSLLEIITHPAAMDGHAFKVAATKKTLAFPVEPRIHLGDLRLLVGLILFACAALVDISIFPREAAGNSALAKERKQKTKKL